MAKPKKTPSETELIAWAIPGIAGGHYAFTDDADGRELLDHRTEPERRRYGGRASLAASPAGNRCASKTS